MMRQDGNQWLLMVFAGLDSTLSLSSVACELVLAEIYDKVDLG